MAACRCPSRSVHTFAAPSPRHGDAPKGIQHVVHTRRPQQHHMAVWAASEQPLKQGGLQQQQSNTCQQQRPQQRPGIHRSGMLRLALLSAAGAAATSGTTLLTPPSAAAATAAALPPMGRMLGVTAGPHSTFVLADTQLLPMPPRPIGFPRRQMELNFAVLLMRSGYETVDDLDYIPMDDFQKVFWKLRQLEWQPYTLSYSPLRITQGQLSDPLYFDFIAFSQGAAAGNEMYKGKQVFEEYSEQKEGNVLVTRDPTLADNALLPGRFYERLGDRMYHALVEGFQGVQYGGPLPCAPGASTDELLAGVQRVLDIYTAQGYALKASLTPGGGGGSTFTVRLEGPANLWSLQALAARRSQLYPQHDALAVAAFLRASGRSSTCRIAWSDTAVTQQWSLA